MLSGTLLKNYIEIRELIEEKSKMYLTEPDKKQAKIIFSRLGDSGILMGAAIQAQKVLFNV